MAWSPLFPARLNTSSPDRMVRTEPDVVICRLEVRRANGRGSAHDHNAPHHADEAICRRFALARGATGRRLVSGRMPGAVGFQLGHDLWSAVSGRGFVLVELATEYRSTPDPAVKRLANSRFRARRTQLQPLSEAGRGSKTIANEREDSDFACATRWHSSSVRLLDHVARNWQGWLSRGPQLSRGDDPD